MAEKLMNWPVVGHVLLLLICWAAIYLIIELTLDTIGGP